MQSRHLHCCWTSWVPSTDHRFTRQFAANCDFGVRTSLNLAHLNNRQFIKPEWLPRFYYEVESPFETRTWRLFQVGHLPLRKHCLNSKVRLTIKTVSYAAGNSDRSFPISNFRLGILKNRFCSFFVGCLRICEKWYAGQPQHTVYTHTHTH